MTKRRTKHGSVNASLPKPDIHDFLLSDDERGLSAGEPGFRSKLTTVITSEEEVTRAVFGPNPDPKSEPYRIRMGSRFELQSPQLFFHWIDLLGRSPQATSKRKRYYFRGESTAEYRLIPSMLRNKQYDVLKEQHIASNPLDLQKRLLDRYKRYTQHLIHADGDFDAPLYDDFDILCLAQHYGLPTLLLDWTLNPFVAAYFAGSGVSRTRLREKLAKCIGMTKYWIRIWVMRLKEPKVREEQTVHLEDRARSERWHSDLGRPGMIPDGPKIVVPLVFTRRIASQVGRFVYCGYMTDHYHDGYVPSLTWFAAHNDRKMPWDELYSLDVTFDISKVKLTAKQPIEDEKRDAFLDQKDSMMKTLEFMGFHAGRLFPDLGGWAQYLADGNL